METTIKILIAIIIISYTILQLAFTGMLMSTKKKITKIIIYILSAMSFIGCLCAGIIIVGRLAF
jgi:hypothetical protein